MGLNILKMTDGNQTTIQVFFSPIANWEWKRGRCCREMQGINQT